MPGLGLTGALLWLSAATQAVAVVVVACYMGGGRGRWLGIKPTAQVHKHPGGGVPISPIPLLWSCSNGLQVVLIVLVRRAQSPHQPSNSSTPLRPSQLTCSYESRVDMWGAWPQRGRGGSTKPSFRRGGGCSWWGVVFVLGVNVGVVVGWCVVMFVEGGVGGVFQLHTPIHI